MKTVTKITNNIKKSNVCPELELILCCARTQIDKVKAERIRELVQQKLDWKKVINHAYSNALIPLLYTNLNNIASNVIPEEQLNTLRTLFYGNAQRNLFLTAEMMKILSLLQDNGIQAVPYKGPVLANLLYGNLSIRQFSDLDILVLSENVLDFKKLLMAQGYIPEIEMTAVEEIAYLQDKSKHTYNLFNKEKRVMVEIHWRIAPQYTSSIEAKHLWRSIKESQFSGTTISTFPVEVWLPILCIHASRHRWEKLSWLSDIAELIRRNPDLNWEEVIDLAWEFDARRMLFLGLLLTRNLIGLDLPKEVVKKINLDTSVLALASEITEELLNFGNAPQKFMKNTFYHIRVKERWQNKLLYSELFLRWLMRDKNVLLDE